VFTWSEKKEQVIEIHRSPLTIFISNASAKCRAPRLLTSLYLRSSSVSVYVEQVESMNYQEVLKLSHAVFNCNAFVGE
jgi:hypothetical protein